MPTSNEVPKPPAELSPTEIALAKVSALAFFNQLLAEGNGKNNLTTDLMQGRGTATRTPEELNRLVPVVLERIVLLCDQDAATAERLFNSIDVYLLTTGETNRSVLLYITLIIAGSNNVFMEFWNNAATLLIQSSKDRSKAQNIAWIYGDLLRILSTEGQEQIASGAKALVVLFSNWVITTLPPITQYSPAIQTLIPQLIAELRKGGCIKKPEDRDEMITQLQSLVHKTD